MQLLVTAKSNLKAAKERGVSERAKEGKERAKGKSLKCKRKENEGASDESDSGQHERKKGGQTKGSYQYSQEECQELVDLALHVVPTGQSGWKKVAEDYNKWVRRNGYPE